MYQRTIARNVARIEALVKMCLTRQLTSKPQASKIDRDYVANDIFAAMHAQGRKDGIVLIQTIFLTL